MVLDPVELERQLELAGLRHRNDMRRLAQLALATGDPTWQQMLQATIRQKAAFVTPVHPFAPSPMPGELPESGVFFGRVVTATGDTGPEFSLPLELFDQHLSVSAMSGAGKSYLVTYIAQQLTAAGIPVWVIDTEAEYVGRLSSLAASGRLVEFTLETFRRNPFEPLPGESDADMVNRVRDVFAEALWLGEASRNVLSEALLKLLGTRRADGETNHPTIPDLLETAETMRITPGPRLQEYRATVVNRLRSIAEMVCYSDCVEAGDFRIDRLLDSDRSIVFKLRGSAYLLNFFVKDLLKALATVLEAKGREGLQLVVVIDEAHRFFGTGQNREYEPILLDLAATFRKRGVGLIVVSQSPADLPRQLAAVTGTKVSLRVADGASARWVADSMALDREQMGSLLELPFRRAVVHSPIWPRPLVVDVPELALPEGVERSDWMEAELVRMKWTPPARPDRAVVGPAVNGKNPNAAPSVRIAEAPEGLSYEAISYLVKIGQTPLWPAGQRDESLGVSNYRGNKLRGELVEAGCIQLIEAPTGRPGNAVTLCELTAQGRAKLEDLGVRLAHARGRGGLLHQWLQERVRLWAAGNGYQAAVESTEARADVALEKDGKRTAVEICVSTEATEWRNVQSDLELFDSVWVVCVEEGTLRKAERSVREQMSENENVKFMLFTELVNSGKGIRQSVASNGKRVGAGGRGYAGAGRDDGRGNAEEAEDAGTASEWLQGEPASREPTPRERRKEVARESERVGREGKNDGRTGSNSEELVFGEVLAALAIIDDPIRLSARPLACVPEIEVYSRTSFAGRPAWRGRGLQQLLREAAALAIAELDGGSASLAAFMKAYVAGATVQDAAQAAGRSREHASRVFRPETAKRIAMHLPTLLAASGERARR